MSWKFNPPPGWPPQPPGWQPPPGWVPDPSWPAAPPHWQFWVSADTTPTFSAPAPSPFAGAPSAQSPFSGAPPAAPPPTAPYQPAAFGGGYPPAGYPGAVAPKPWYQHGWVIGGAVAAVVVLLAGMVGVGTFVLLRSDDPGTNVGQGQSTPGPTPSPGTGSDTTEPGTAPVGADARTYEGEGSDVLALELVGGEPYTVTITHTGAGWFEAWATLDSRDVTSLGWAYGDFSGTRALGLYPDEEADAIRIEATGSWTVAVRALAESPSWPAQDDGTGSMVLLVDPGAQQAVTGTHAGESNFIVWAYVEDSYPDLLFNEIGDYSGSAVLPAGTYAISIEADGAWTIQEK